MSTFEVDDAVSWDSALGRKTGVVERVDEDKQTALVKMAPGNSQWFPFAKLRNDTQHRAAVDQRIAESNAELWERIRSGKPFTRRIGG
jgi:hypothetical protein